MRNYYSRFLTRINRCGGVSKDLPDDIADPIPDIFCEYRKIFSNGKQNYISDDFMIIECKKDSIEDEEIVGHKVKNIYENRLILYNNDGYIEEYNNDGSKNDIRTILIEDEQTAGNYIIGTLISHLYPDIKTIAMNRYRGWSNNIIKGDALQNEYFIGTDSQGYDNPFIFVEKLPNAKWFLFDGDEVYNKIYYVDGKIDNPICFKEEFDRVAKIQSNFVGIMFFITKTEELYEPPNGWTRRTIDFPNQNTTECYWVAYEKIK